MEKSNIAQKHGLFRKPSCKEKKTPAEMAVYSLVFLIFCLFAATYVYIVVWCFYSGLRSADEFVMQPFGFSSVDFSNYLKVFEELEVNHTNYWGMLWNSVYFSVFGCALTIMVTTMFAYVIAKYNFPGHKFLYTLVVVVLNLPLYGSGGGMYKLLWNIGFINSRLMLLTSCGGFTMYFLYMHAFFTSMSSTYMEAAEIDGANEWQIFFRIMFPQSLAMAGSLYIMQWMAEWNSYGTALIYLNKMPTLAVGIYLFETRMMYSSKMNILCAACFISMIPPLVIFATCNGLLMANVSLGGIKE